MRVNRLGAWIIATFLCGGLLLCALAWFLLFETDGGALAGAVVAFVGVPWVVGALAALLISIRQEARARHRRWLARHGLLGRALIVSGTSGLSVNEHPYFELVLDLDVPGRPRRRVEHRCVIGNFAARRIRAGMVLPVYVNPNRPEDILLVW
ncbi:MAG TPA: hypothetical protein VHF58_10475 [Solirubrobacterales bacterium]|nr:hypothetical protein [Solirubrobacterales bacterium]